MKRLVSLLAFAVSVLLLVAVVTAPLTVFAQDGHGDDDPQGESEGDSADHGDTEGDTEDSEAQHDDELAALRGAAVYAEFCQACHGPQGEAIASGPAFQAIGFDAEHAHDVISDGLDSDETDGVAMPAYGKVLSEDQRDDVIAYMETWETGDTPALPEPNITVEVESVPDYFGDAQAGATVYAKFCAGCHGAEGEGHKGDAFPKLDIEAHNVRLIIENGVESDYMPGFAEQAGGPLSAQHIDDLETYLASWQLDEETTGEDADTGIAVMIVILGAVAILTVGISYLARSMSEAEAKDQTIL